MAKFKKNGKGKGKKRAGRVITLLMALAAIIGAIAFIKKLTD